MTENVEQFRNQIALARTEIKNLRQQLSALKHEHLKEIQSIKSTLGNLKCSSCNVASSHYTILNTTEAPSASNSIDEGTIIYKPIGYVKTSFQNKRGVPRQPSVMMQAQGTVVVDQTVFNNPDHALSGLEEFSHMWIIFHFHSLESSSISAKVSPPRLEGERRGVYSTRSPHRPCAIGLSLVKIHSIEGNKIHFFGVDMINGTPVLDIKPYIPQYDYPLPNYGDNRSMERPRTEGISSAGDALATLQITNDGFDIRSLSPHVGSPVVLDTSPQALAPYEDEIPPPLYDDIPPPQFLDNLTPESPNDTQDGHRSLDYERGAPDGQERFIPPNAALTNTSHDGIRIASWITNPPSQTYQVRFTDDVITRLQQLIGDRSESFKVNIQSLLSDDPRSNYVKNRYPDHEYCCVLEDLSISCVFDSCASICTIIAVRNAEEMQQS